MEIVRRSRWDESPEPLTNKPKQPFAIVGRDILILETLMRYALLRSTYLWEMVPGSQKKHYLKRLRQLKDAGYIERPKEQLAALNRNGTPTIYRISEKGFKYLKERGNTDKRWRTQITQFAHAVAVCEVIAGVEIALLGHPTLRFIPQDEIMNRAPVETQTAKNPWAFPVSIEDTIAGRTVKDLTHYVADGWFGIEFPPADGDTRPRRRYYALEINHGANVRAKNLKDASHHRKFLSLNELRLQGIFKKRLGIRAPVVALFVQATESVTLNSMSLLGELSHGGSERFAFKTIPSFQELRVAPKPDGTILTQPWRRVGFDELRIDEA